jgi:hypothetical protein
MLATAAPQIPVSGSTAQIENVATFCLAGAALGGSGGSADASREKDNKPSRTAVCRVWLILCLPSCGLAARSDRRCIPAQQVSQ